MNLILFVETIALCKLAEDEALDLDPGSQAPLNVIIEDPHGTTVICPRSHAENKGLNVINESFWRCFQIDAVMDFNTVGVLAEFSGLLAERDIPMMAICSFETDYLMVQPRHVEAAVQAFEQAGHTVKIDND